MTEQEKKELVEAFNVERFFEWQGKYYEDVPEEIEDALKAHNDEVWEAWQKKTAIPSLNVEIRKTLDDYSNRKKMVEVWEMMGFKLMPLLTLKTLEYTVTKGIEREIEELKQRVSTGVVSRRMVLKKRLDYGFELIDFNLLEWVSGEWPLTEQQPMEAMLSLLESGLCRWILKELESPQLDGKAANEESGSKNPKPLKWKGQKNTLMAFFGELKRREYIEGSGETLSKWMHLMFENVGKPETIAKKLRDPVLPKRDAEQIEAIFTELERYSE